MGNKSGKLKGEKYQSKRERRLSLEEDIYQERHVHLLWMGNVIKVRIKNIEKEQFKGENQEMVLEYEDLNLFKISPQIRHLESTELITIAILIRRHKGFTYFIVEKAIAHLLYLIAEKTDPSGEETLRIYPQGSKDKLIDKEKNKGRITQLAVKLNVADKTTSFPDSNAIVLLVLILLNAKLIKEFLTEEELQIATIFRSLYLKDKRTEEGNKDPLTMEIAILEELLKKMKNTELYSP